MSSEPVITTGEPVSRPRRKRRNRRVADAIVLDLEPAETASRERTRNEAARYGVHPGYLFAAIDRLRARQAVREARGRRADMLLERVLAMVRGDPFKWPTATELMERLKSQGVEAEKAELVSARNRAAWRRISATKRPGSAEMFPGAPPEARQ